MSKNNPQSVLMTPDDIMFIFPERMRAFVDWTAAEITGQCTK